MTLSFKTPKGALSLALSDIVTCKALGKNTALRYRSEQHCMRDVVVFHLLGEVEERLGMTDMNCTEAQSVFVRCHRSVLVNLRHCSAWKSDGSGLSVEICAGGIDGGSVQVSRRQVHTFLEAFTRMHPPVR
jgi:hypothetical protein